MERRLNYLVVAGLSLALCGLTAALGTVTGKRIPATVAALGLATLLAAATYHDVRRFRIPNALTYPALLSALLFNAVASLANAVEAGSMPAWTGAIGVTPSLVGAVTGFVIMAAVFAVTGCGAGDVKLAAAIGSVAGPAPALSVIVWTHLLAGVFALAWVAWQIGPLRPVLCGICGEGHAAVVAHDRIFNRSLPLAGFFAAGAILTCGGLLL